MHRGMWGASVNTSPLTTSNHLSGFTVVNVNGTTGAGMMSGMTNGISNKDASTYTFTSPNSSSTTHLLGNTSPLNSTISMYGISNSLPRQRSQQVCKYFVNGGCLRGANCPYSHELPDERHLDVNGLGFIFNPNVHNAQKGVAATQSNINSIQIGHLSPGSGNSPLTLALGNQSNSSKLQNYVTSSTNFYSDHNNNSYKGHAMDGSEHVDHIRTIANNSKRQNHISNFNVGSNNSNSMSRNRKSSTTTTSNSIGSNSNEFVAPITQLKSISNANFILNSGMATSASVTTNTALNNFTNASNSSQSSLPASISSTPNIVSNNSAASPINISASKTNVLPCIDGIAYNGWHNNVIENSKKNNNTNNNNIAVNGGVGTGINRNYTNNTLINTKRSGTSDNVYCADAELLSVNNSGNNSTLTNNVKNSRTLVLPKYRPPEPFLQYNLPPVLALPLKVPASDFAETLTNMIL